jgi:hypothetical protein
MKRGFILAAVAATTLAGCAPGLDQIGTAFVSPSAFASLSCSQLVNELAIIEPRLAEAEALQTAEATHDAVVVTGAVLLLPIAGLMAAGGPDYSTDIASMRGQIEAIETVARARNC